jgi:hypothetical protein
VKELDAKGTFLDFLYEKGVLDEHELDVIKTITTRQARNSKLLDFIRKTTLTEYKRFLEALNESHQSHIRDKLQNGQ